MKVAIVAEDQMAITAFFSDQRGGNEADSGKYEWGTTVTNAYLPNINSKFFPKERMT